MSDPTVLRSALLNLMRGDDDVSNKNTTLTPLVNNNLVPLQYYNPMARVNPIYTQAQPYDALEPMAMYQQFMQTGQVPQAQAQFVQWNPPSASPSASPSIFPSATAPQATQAVQKRPQGGK